MKIESLVRENIRALSPYSSARDEFSGADMTFLDANESSVENGVNRYPDPYQSDLKGLIAAREGVEQNQVFIGNGSDETLDLLFRVFCEPRRDNVIILPPTYGMYKVLAHINDVACREVPLLPDLSLDVRRILDEIDAYTRLIFICSPNNPTGNDVGRKDILEIADAFEGIVVVDEAYIDFSDSESLIKEIGNYPNLFVNQTFSKSRSAAGLRLGVGVANQEVIRYVNRIKPPYNIGTLAQQRGMELFQDEKGYKNYLAEIRREKTRLREELKELSLILEIFPSDANFLLVRVSDANGIYKILIANGIVVRNRTKERYCENTLRITVGSPEENRRLMECLRNIDNK